MSPDEPAAALPLRHAVALGLLHGPAELLPVSSSGHVTLIPWLAGWPYGELDAELRKAFEVALHGGAAAAFVIFSWDELIPKSARRSALLALSVAPTAALGYLFERPIEQRLGTPPSVALGLIVGGLALALADRSPQARGADDAGARDALWLALAQATALYPGVSRGGATLAAARILAFNRAGAQRLSRELAVPVIVGASVLKGVRLRARRLPRAARRPFGAGALASFASTLASIRLLVPALEDRPLVQYAAYRMALGAAVLVRWRAAAGAPPLRPASKVRLHAVDPRASATAKRPRTMRRGA
jgi:undecaprenyl-diphosphatase